MERPLSRLILAGQTPQNARRESAFSPPRPPFRPQPETLRADQVRLLAEEEEAAQEALRSQARLRLRLRLCPPLLAGGKDGGNRARGVQPGGMCVSVCVL